MYCRKFLQVIGFWQLSRTQLQLLANLGLILYYFLASVGFALWLSTINYIFLKCNNTSYIYYNIVQNVDRKVSFKMVIEYTANIKSTLKISNSGKDITIKTEDRNKQ